MSKWKARELIDSALRDRRTLVRKLVIGTAIANRPKVHEPQRPPKER